MIDDSHKVVGYVPKCPNLHLGSK